MSRPTAFLSALVVAVVATVTPAPVGAVPFDKLTFLTFSGSVQIPGVTLAPGTYRFHLTNPDTSRNVVQVLSHDGSAVFAMFHTIPDSRVEVTEEPTVTFKETPVGVPPAIKSLFYGGEHRGYEFVYGPLAPMVRRLARPQAEVTYTYTPPPVLGMVESEPVLLTEPEPLEPTLSYAEVVPPVVAELPATATRLPWVTVGGFGLLVLGLGAGLLRRHVSVR